MKRVYRIGEVARRLQLSVEKVRDLEAEGVLKAERTDGGHRVFRESDVAAYERRLDGKRPQRVRSGSGRKRLPSARTTSSFFDGPPEEEVDHLPEDDEDWDDSDVPILTAEGFSPTPRARPVQQSGISGHVNRPSAADRAQAEHDAEAEPKRLQDLKNAAMKAIPLDLPAVWRAKIIEDLEVHISTERLPPWVPAFEQTKLARGRVDTTVKAYRDECNANVAREREQRNTEAARVLVEQNKRRAQEDAARRVKMLVAHGLRYLEQDIDDWDDPFDQDDVRREVQKLLNADVKTDWDERDVEALVDDELEEWEEYD